MPRKPVDILLVDDSPGDIRLTREAFACCQTPVRISVVFDGEQALDYLHQRGEYRDAPRPDLVFLDLNMPRRDGREVLQEVRATAGLETLPIIVFTMSDDESDVALCYQYKANCVLTKPIDVYAFIELMREVQNFWLRVASFSWADAAPAPKLRSARN